MPVVLGLELCGWDEVAGPFYVVVGIVLGLTRPGFDFAQHGLSLLMLGDHGWMQRANLSLSGLMVLVAAYGVLRTIRNGRGLAMATLTATYGACMILSAVFPPDPVEGFPAGSPGGEVSTSGVLHIVFGAIGFIALAAAAFVFARWSRDRDESRGRLVGIACGAIILVGFLGGAALALSTTGVVLLWLAVLTGWVWLAFACTQLYNVVPHPVLSQRAKAAS